MSVIPCPHCQGSGVLIIEDQLPGRLVAEVLNSVAAKHGLLVRDVIGPSRCKELVAARKEASRWLRGSGFSLKEIGFYLGKRDHSTIIHALNGHA